MTRQMKRRTEKFRPAVAAVVAMLTMLTMLAVGTTFQVSRAADAGGDDRQEAEKLLADGNYREALDKFQPLVLHGKGGEQTSSDFRHALQCYLQLNRVHEIDDFREEAATRFAGDWQALAAIAESYLDGQYHGYMIAGEFRRGNHRGGGKIVHATARDRVRALQLFRQALQLAEKQPEVHKTQPAQRLLERFAAALMHRQNGQRSAWKMQLLTKLETGDKHPLPDYEEGWGYYGGQTRGAPVDQDGKPVFYSLPKSWQAATNDGERWRWVLEKSVEWDPSRRNDEQLTRARFLQSQFGVETMASSGWWFGRRGADEAEGGTQGDAKTGTYALHTLGENETIAKLATGIARIELPDEQNHIKLFQQVLASEDKAYESQRLLAAQALATLFENRRQYPRAAEYWREAIQLTTSSSSKQHYRQRLKQIVDNWGQFESVMTQPAGQGATVDFRFRNGKRVEFIAKKIKLRQLLDDMKTLLKSNPNRLQWDRVQLENLGYRLVTGGQEKYLGEEVARWSLDLEPRPDHFDRRTTITTPLQDAGAYLLTAKMTDGNSCSIVMWLSDTAIVKKQVESNALYYVADAVTGKPLAKCHVEFFGYWQEHVDGPKRGGPKYAVHTKNFAEFTDENGLVELPVDDANRRYQWVAIATTPEGRFAYLGFRGVWAGRYFVPQYEQVKALAITDRPVYRPGQPVKFKFWVRHAQYGQEDQSRFAGQTFQIEIRDPRNEPVYTTSAIADGYGGLQGEWTPTEDATLGQYSLGVVNHGGGTFRVEEYKKPEFEVTVEASDKPVALGEKITAKIIARYYFGSPVTQATVKYKIFRSEHNQRWYPPGPWDWLYGPGYWWFAEDYPWYPGWRHWGCQRPSPWWFWRQPAPPELVAEREVPIGPDGTVEVTIDTAIAKAIHPDQDHSYRIEAEVVDASRRTIVGTGQVLVARQPFRVYAWTHRGYYRVGDTIDASFSARTLDGKPVEGTGTLRLLKIQYKDAEPVETEVSRWELAPDSEGLAQLQIKASEAGQYRLAYEVTDAAGHAIDGGHLFTITGEGFDGSEFRFNDLELVSDRRDYQPGEKVALQINTNRAGAVVLLFVRTYNSMYAPPQIVRMAGKSTVVEIEVAATDAPNFFVEAVTVHSGRLHTATREIHVPPASRVLGVEVVPSAEAYLPGGQAKLRLKLTDADGKPFVGSTVLAIYDKALEYIAGGTNVPDIREFFWKWRRSHRPQGETNLHRSSRPLSRRNTPTMQSLGIFGGTVAEELAGEFDNRKMKSRAMGGGGFALGLSLGKNGRADSLAAMPEAVDAASDLAPGENASASGAASNQPPTLQIRKNLADTALWVASLETKADGIAEVEFDMPENLTTWMIRVWGMGHGTRVGQGTAEVVTRKDIIVRLQAPRFFVERDEVVLSANVHNYLAEAKQVRVQLALPGSLLEGPEQLEQVITIPAGGEDRVDWRVKVVREGTATVRMSALTSEESDAVEMQFPVYVHGMLKTDSFSGVLRRTENLGGFTFTVPAERRAEQSRLEIRYSPTLAGAMVDALPYLLDYPYGCTEQTLNRFLPAVITQQTLKRMGLDLAAIREKRTNLNPQEIGPEDGNDAERATQWKRFDRNPVFDDNEMAAIVKVGVGRLSEMQLADGGWGWFSGWGEHSSPHTTAIVVHGLQIAQQNGVALLPGVVERGRAWLRRYQARQLRLLANWEEEPDAGRRKKNHKRHADNTDALVAMVLAENLQAGRAGAFTPQIDLPSSPPATVQLHEMLDYLYRDRKQLAVYSLANFGLALQYQDAGARDASASRRNNEKEKKSEMLRMVMRNISQYVRQDDENQTAWLELPGGQWWHWYGSEYEAHAYYLKLLAVTEPKSEVAPRLVKYLLSNRKHATYWNSTRDTALVVEAFAEFLKASGEDKPDVALEIWIDGQLRKSVEINGDNLFTFDNRLVLTGDQIAAGQHTVELRKQGTGPIYFNGYQANFTLEDHITAAGLELKVERKYYKLTPVEATANVAGGHGQAVAQRVEKFDRTLLANLDELASGDLVEVELIVDSKNDYEYIVLEDMKAAGFEPVAIRSGYNGNELGAYMELRDNRVSLFVAQLARGWHSVSYRLRAEIPGKFSALPTRASAMYAPELRANSEEIKLRIVE